jgi:hypothetical protein
MKIIQAIVLLTIVTITSNAYSQNVIKTSKTNNKETHTHKLIGTWRIIEYSDFDSISNKWVDRYGKHPRGYFMYTKSGIVNINISTDHPIKISEDSAKNMSINYYQMYKNDSFGYFGNFTVDFKKSIVTHHVKGGSLLWYIDTDQPRSFLLKNDTLTIGDNRTTRRVLVKAD